MNLADMSDNQFIRMFASPYNTNVALAASENPMVKRHRARANPTPRGLVAQVRAECDRRGLPYDLEAERARRIANGTYGSPT